MESSDRVSKDNPYFSVSEHRRELSSYPVTHFRVGSWTSFPCHQVHIVKLHFEEPTKGTAKFDSRSPDYRQLLSLLTVWFHLAKLNCEWNTWIFLTRTIFFVYVKRSGQIRNSSTCKTMPGSILENRYHFVWWCVGCRSNPPNQNPQR